ncbi:hypothetical protein HY626_04260 [Candidatus Uhrbacteria bacterium]|nr:hypothetical protein [Candidatus Uhrbacteria bacterium]
MGRGTYSNAVHRDEVKKATRGGTQSATTGAEEQARLGGGLDPLVNPKGLLHLGPVRMSLPRFELQPSGLWMLTIGMPMAVELLLDTTGSMGDNVDMALGVLPETYAMLAGGDDPVLGRYDTQIANAVFGDVKDLEYSPNKAVLCRSQFEMAGKITQQLTLMVPSRMGCGNGKEDPQYGIFGAAYLTASRINAYGLKTYHFTVSDEPVAPGIDLEWLKRIFGETVLDAVEKNGHPMSAQHLPDTAQAVRDLQMRAHAFFLQVGDRADVTRQWHELYGADHCIMLPDGTGSLHLVEALVIGLTEGVLELSDAKGYLVKHGADRSMAQKIVRAVSGIPLGAQTQADNFTRLPKAGDLFRQKTDLWPLSPDELSELASEGTPKEPETPKINWL